MSIPWEGIVVANLPATPRIDGRIATVGRVGRARKRAIGGHVGGTIRGGSRVPWRILDGTLLQTAGGRAAEMRSCRRIPLLEELHDVARAMRSDTSLLR